MLAVRKNGCRKAGGKSGDGPGNTISWLSQESLVKSDNNYSINIPLPHTHTLPSHTQGDGRYLITNSKDQSIKLWDIRKFSSEEGIQATLDKVKHQGWDYRYQSVPKESEYLDSSREATKDSLSPFPLTSPLSLPPTQRALRYYKTYLEIPQ